jgi:hypothetical protein
MYAIYKWEPSDVTAYDLIAITLTKQGAKRACEQARRIFRKETSRNDIEILFEEVMYFPALKLGYGSLLKKRAHEKKRLEKLKYKETIAINNKFAQEKRVASLY